MARSLYLINPRSDHPTYFGAEAFEHHGFPAAAAIADLALTTVAALAPPDWTIELCDEFVSAIDFDTEADFVGITGKVNQGARMREVADEFRRRGRTVIIGGPFASLSPDAVREHCDVLLVGELESIAAELFSDLERGRWRREYLAMKPDLETSPLPRFELYPNHRALFGCVQTSRGCPFDCEFCDVIQYLGRQQRHKSDPQILAELDVLYGLGYRAVFLADDNFTVYRKRAKSLLQALRDWNASRPAGPVGFFTQVSIDAARDQEILRLCGEAGLTGVFIGIETPNEESLRETRKRQNVGIDLVGQVQAFLAHGIAVTGGMIVGFDHDGPDIFERQLRFAQSAPIPIFTLGALVAPAATPLYDRMRSEGRLVEDGSEIQGVWNTNIEPLLMTRAEMMEGIQWLANRLYEPRSFTHRMLAMIESLGPQLGPFGAGYAPQRGRPVELEALGVVRRLIASGPEERRMWRTVSAAMAEQPDTGPLVMASLFRYAQVRCLYEVGSYWDPEPASAPLLSSAPTLA